MSIIPDVHFGEIRKDPLDWRKFKDLPGDEVDDDIELAITPKDIIDILGFDPKEL